MTFTVVTGDDPRLLVDRFARELQRQPLSPFELERVVIQSYGMERWIRLELAKRLGCAASLDFSFPAALCHTLARSLGVGELDERFGREALTWRLFDLLSSDVVQRSEFATLAGFVSRSDDRARLGLASRIAARFDDYQLYRPEILLAWESGVVTHARPDFDEQAVRHVAWQAALWRELCGGEEPMHLARWFAAANERLVNAEAVPDGFPARLTVFGISTLPDLFLKLIRAASRFVPVRMYVVAPPRRTWEMRDALVPNPVMRAFGETMRRFLLPLTVEQGIEWEELEPAAPRPATVLGALQRDVRDGVERGPDAGLSPRLSLASSDDSISVHVCHSELREMEVLRDQLIAAFDADPSLRPHDILVMVPDVTKYAPFAEAVFGNAEPGMPWIPYHLADRPVAQESSLAQGLLRVLALTESRLTAGEVIGLLDVPAISRGAGLGEGGAVAAARWVEEAAIRWGSDGAMRAAQFDLPALGCNTWREGLDRLVVGYATGACDDIVDDLLPVAGDTLGDAEALGAFADWVRRLFERLDEWRSPRAARAWVESLRDLVAGFIVPASDREQRELAKIMIALDRLEEAAGAASVTRPISLSLVRQALERELGDEGFGSQLLAGGMTICALKPMRTIPFRVIAIAGLDDASFPRRTRRAGYDLLEIDSRPGLEARVGADRDVRADDRQLFFDTLLAARDRLIITYVGRSARDNKARAQSVVLAELLDTVDRAFVREDGKPAHEALVVEHRLQPFSAAYFTGDEHSRLFSYSARHAAALSAQRTGGSAAPFVDGALVRADETEEIRVADLVSCWRDPSRFFATQALGLYLAQDAEALDDSEPFTVDARAAFARRAEALESHLAGSRDAARERERMLHSGTLPPAEYGKAILAAEMVDAEALIAEVGAAQFAPATVIDIAGTGWRIHGRAEGLTTDGTRLHAQASKCKSRDVAAAWVMHVLVNVQRVRDGSPVCATRFVSRDVAFTMAPPVDGEATLAELVRGYHAALGGPLPFFPECSREFTRERRSNNAPIVRAARLWSHDDEWRAPGEGDDAYAQLCWRDRNPFADEASFREWAEGFWSPVVTAAPEVP